MNGKIMGEALQHLGNVSQIYTESVESTGYTATLTCPFPIKMLIYLISSQGSYTYMVSPDFPQSATFSNENTTVSVQAGSAGSRGYQFYAVAFG